MEPSKLPFVGKNEFTGRGKEVKIWMENELKDDQMFLISQSVDL